MILGAMITSSPARDLGAEMNTLLEMGVLYTDMLIITTIENGRGKSTGYDLCFSGIKT